MFRWLAMVLIVHSCMLHPGSGKCCICCEMDCIVTRPWICVALQQPPCNGGWDVTSSRRSRGNHQVLQARGTSSALQQNNDAVMRLIGLGRNAGVPTLSILNYLALWLVPMSCLVQQGEHLREE